MKKYLIIVLSILLLFSVTSCNKDKSAEVANNFVNFCDSVNYGFAGSGIFNTSAIETSCKADKSFELSLATADDIIDADDFYDFWDNYLDNLEEDYYGNKASFQISKKTGKISGTYTDSQNYSINMSDVTLDYKYDVWKRYSGDKVYDTSEEKLTLSGSVSCSVDENKILTGKVNVTVNGKAYKCEFKVNLKTGVYISGSYNGAAISEKLLKTLSINIYA